MATTAIYNANYEINYLVEQVKLTFNNIQRENLRDMNLTELEMKKKEHLKAELKQSLKEAAFGSQIDKIFVKNYIKDIIQGKIIGINKDNIDEIIPFNTPSLLKDLDKHEILFHVYSNKRKLGKNGFVYMIQEHGLLEEAKRAALADTTGQTVIKITSKMIDDVYKKVMRNTTLTYDDRLEIVAQRIFEKYKGFGAVDVLRDTSLDGISGGVSGIPASSFEIFNVNLNNVKYSYESIWCMLKGVSINLEYLSFESEAELIRICKNIYKYNSPGTMSEADGKIISTMKDGSRVAVARPPLASSWCFWTRKFDSVESLTPDVLLRHDNKEVPITFTKWLIKGCCTTMITGQPGCGKTTYLKSIICYIDPSYPLRIAETAAELNLNYTYIGRNIIAFQEKGANTQDILDFIKKTDGAVNILGEVATHEAASWFIQNAMIASLMSLGTHHAKTTRALVNSLRLSLLNSGGFNNEKVAEEQVVEALRINIHMVNVKGERYIDKITEIVPIYDRRYPSERNEAAFYERRYPSERNMIEDMSKMDTLEYYKRVTDRETFTENVLCEFDKKNHCYVFCNMPTPELIETMKQHYTAEEEQQFDQDMIRISSLGRSLNENTRS